MRDESRLPGSADPPAGSLNRQSAIRVVVVDDSPFVCRLLTSHLQSSPDIEVVGAALDGARGVKLVKELRPDAVTLDLEMPEMNGLEALEQIMYECPTPVILISGVSKRAAALTLQAIELGAVDFILKYTPGSDTNPDTLRQEIIAKVRAAAQTKVIRLLRPTHADKKKVLPFPSSAAPDPYREGWPLLAGGIVVIGASTGGPLALRQLLTNLPADFSAAIIIVQHMPGTFTGVLAEQLNRQVRIKVKEAKDGDRLEPGAALVAPGGYHLLLRPDSTIELNEGPEIGGHRPSIDVTMQSAAQIYGSRCKGVVLTGMGSDGSLGMVAIRSKGGKTFAQDAASCVIGGMPQRAIEKGVVDYIAPPEQLAQLLVLGQPTGARREKIC